MAAVLRTPWPVGTTSAGEALMGGDAGARRSANNLANFAGYSSGHSSYSNQSSGRGVAASAVASASSGRLSTLIGGQIGRAHV